MKKNVLPRAVAAVVLLAVIVLTMVFLVTGNFNIFTQVASPLEMSRNVQSGNTQNLKSSAAPVRLPAAPAPTPGTSRVAVPAGCVYRP